MDWETIIAWLSQGASIVTSVTAIGGFVWYFVQKFYLKPREKKREKEAREREKREQERNEKLIRTIEKSYSPTVELLEKTSERTNHLEDIAEQSMEMHEEWRKNFDRHDRRIWELESITQGGKTTTKYKEIYEGKNS